MLLAPRRGDPDRYQILAEHGRGGLGRVYRARDKELGRHVALKELLQPSYTAEVRFFREAFITARLEHPAIVPVHEAGRWPDGTPYYAMKLVSGRPLAKLIADAKELDGRLALIPHLIAVADAIAYAHDRKIIHRDLKPSNVIVGDFGETIVIDWGLAKELAVAEDEVAADPYRIPGASTVTVAGSVLGTPAYMSPEQARGEAVDTRTDVYSLGAMLFQLCTGDVPPSKASEADLSNSLRPVPQDLKTIALKALSPNPDDRYADAGAFAADLRAFDNGARIAAREYSLLAVLGHWVRHHKRFAASVAVLTILVSVLGGVALREIVLRGERATAARTRAQEERAIAQSQRDRAVRSEAALLLEKDPTKAHDLLSSMPNLPATDALLLARARGAGIADRIISLMPSRIYRAWADAPDESLRTLTVVAADGKLRSIDLSTGKVDLIASSLPQPAIVIRERQGLVYVRRGSNGPEIVKSWDKHHAIDISGYRPSYENPAVRSADALYLLDESGHLSTLAPEGHLRPAMQSVQGMAPYHDGLLVCAHDKLWLVHLGRTNKRLGACRHDGSRYSLATSGESFAIQETPETIVLQRGGVSTELRIAEPNAFALARGGLLIGVGKGKAWFVRPSSDEVQDGPQSSAQPTALAADGDLAGWGYADGVTRIRDTASGASWTLVGHTAPIAWMFVSARLRRVVTVAGPEVRVWKLPRFAPEVAGNLACDIFTIAPSKDGRRLAFDCADGTVNVVELGPVDRLVTLHRHTNIAMGLTWRENEVCSAGWDGRVICTDVISRRTMVVAATQRAIRAIHAAGRVLAYSPEDGSVWSQSGPDAKPELRYKHDAEVYALAVSSTGSIASGAYDGSVMTYDTSTGDVHRALSRHTDRVFTVRWNGDDLYTTSNDGTIRLWTRGLSLRQTTTFDRPVREFEPIKSGWIASVGGTRLLVNAKDMKLDLETGSLIRDLAISQDGRYAGAVVEADLIIVDLWERAVAAVRLGGGSSSCAQFMDPSTMLACGSPREIVSIELDRLPFVKFHTDDR